MTKKRKKDGPARPAVLPVMRPDAAGIDIGATEIFVAVPVDRASIRGRYCTMIRVGGLRARKKDQGTNAKRRNCGRL